MAMPHALWDVIRKSRVGYRGEARPSTRQSEILFALYSNSANCPSMAHFTESLVVSDWLINRSLKFYSRIGPPFAKGGGGNC